jgi:hypothetical protein
MRKLLIETTPLNSEDYDAINSLDNSSSTDDESNGPRGCAGTDHPWYDDGNGFEITGSYDDDDALPFGYFPVDPKTKELKFFIGTTDYGETMVHAEIFGQALYDYLYNFIMETFEPVEDELCEKMKEFHDFAEENGLEHQERLYGFNRVCVFEDKNGGNRIVFKDVVSDAFNKLGITIPVTERLAKLIFSTFEDAYWDLSDFCDEFLSALTCDIDLGDEYDQNYVCSMFGFEANDLFQDGRLEGRIWFDTGLITFYPGQQPSRDEMKQVIKDIAENEGRAETEFYGFYTIFEVGSKKPYTGTGYKMHDDATIQCCTVADYIEGKYSGFNREAEIEMVKNRKGIDAFNVHLANQNVKKNFFKNFRNTRDKAVYAPREKAAGTLAGYHAMRYPFGESRKSSGKLLINEHYDQAGTDFPSYYDEETGEWYEASWNNDYGFPFGYWPIDDAGNEEFFVGEAYDTHTQACGQAAKVYFTTKIRDAAYEAADEIATSLNDFIEYFNENNFQYDEDGDRYVSEELPAVKTFDDFVDMVRDNVYTEIGDAYEYMSELVENFLENGSVVDYENIAEHLIEVSNDEYTFHERNDIDEALEAVGSSFDEFFQSGHSEGRVWPYANMIGFYETEQPEPYQLMQILHALDDYADLDVDNLLEYHIVFEDWHNNGTITACTVQDYIDGNYGPNKDEDEEEEEAERQYARDGKTVFVPHLANQEDKFNFFKNFRDTRDRAVYTPREKAAGTLAGYHAMRYPYGENRKRLLQMIDEEIDKIMKKGD